MEQIVLADAAIVSHSLPVALEVLGDSWRASGVELQGSYRGGRLEVERSRMQVTLEGSRRPAVEGALATRFTLDRDGTFDVDSFELAADGLSLSARSAGNLVERTVDELQFELDADPARLTPDLTSSGHCKARGERRAGPGHS